MNPENGYRYYSIEQLEAMLFINRLKLYQFSLEEIKTIIHMEKDTLDEALYFELDKKKMEFKHRVQMFRKIITQLENDMTR